MEGKCCTLEVRVHGRSVHEYRHEGKTYIEGRKESEFTLRVRNIGPQRVLAVLSVDGLSVMDGKEAKFDSGGYIVEPFDYVDVPGWRLDLNETARFIFSKAAASYAAQTGRPLNVGVIGLAVFREVATVRIKWNPPSFSFSDLHICRGITCPGPSIPRDVSPIVTWERINSVTCNAGPQAAGQVVSNYHVQAEAPVSSELGTGFGEAVQHRVNSTTFNRESNTPAELLEVFYDSREGLRRRGVDLDKKPTVATPSPFPGQGFCTPPSRWSR